MNNPDRADLPAPVLKPIPTRIKKEYNVSELRTVLGNALKDIKGDEIVSVMQRESDTKVIVRREYLFELINLCNSLLYDKIQFESVPARDNSEEMLSRGLDAIERKSKLKD